MQTLDISHNQLQNVQVIIIIIMMDWLYVNLQQTWIPKKLSDLDISGNLGLSTKIGSLSRNLHNINHIVFEGKSTKSKVAGVTLGGMPAHGKWTYGSSHAPGKLTVCR